MTRIETDRLLLRPYTTEDAEAMSALHADPAVMKFLKDSNPLSPDEAAETFQRYLYCWETFGHGVFAVRRKLDGEYVGECGHWVRTDKPGVSMRFMMHREFWGNGFGREMNEAVTAWLFSATDVMSFWAVTQSRNKGAVAILRRLGGRLTENAHTGQPGLLRFDVDRPAWEKVRAALQDE